MAKTRTCVNINIVVLEGYLTNDPYRENKFLANAQIAVQFVEGENKNVEEFERKWETIPLYFRIMMKGEHIVANNTTRFKKGDKIIVRGQIDISETRGKTGEQIIIPVIKTEEKFIMVKEKNIKKDNLIPDMYN
jgi:single-stranded DNA-binding protein